MRLQATNWDEEVACSMTVVEVSLKRAAMRVCSSRSTALVLPCKPHNALCLIGTHNYPVRPPPPPKKKLYSLFTCTLVDGEIASSPSTIPSLSSCCRGFCEENLLKGLLA